MLTFCPHCSNMLIVAPSAQDGANSFCCPTCPYEYSLAGAQVQQRRVLERKQVDDVLGGQGAWDNVDQTQAQCPVDACGSTRAYFFQLQIRSADEPMTTFYKCTGCSHQWREN